MRIIKITTAQILLYILLLQASAGHAQNFTGTWNVNFEKSTLEDKTEGLTGVVFIIHQDGDKLHLARYHYFGSKSNKISFRMKADGKTRNVKIFYKGKLEKTENGLKATLWRKNFLNVVDYKFGIKEDELIADEVFTGLPKNHHNIWVFDKSSTQR